ncbi:TPA: hypothetical protein DDZ10_00115 [Candidatus Uhrbacteria bacterium]|nr:hypothetical protein [Candidatus Uhrbacteria bacterium]
MKHLYRLLLIGIAAVGFSTTPLLTQAAAPTVFISEVSWAGSSLSASDEFLELFNPSDETVSLLNWSLHGSATGGEALAFPDDAVIPPHSTYLIANYDTDEEPSALNFAPNLVTSRLSLPNTKLSVALVDGARVVLDRVGDDSGSPASGSAGISMMRVSPSLDGDSDEAWVSATSSQGFKDALSNLGTPGSHEMNVEIAEADRESKPAPKPQPSLEAEAERTVEEAQPAPIQVHPMEDSVITVIYQGFVFELNLPKQHFIKSASSTAPISVSAPEAPATSNVVQTVSPPTSEIAALMKNATTETTEVSKTAEKTEASAPAIPVMSLQTLRFSEVYPNTVGNDEEEEYIEIENFGDKTINLLGWSIRDATEKTWTADGSFELSPGKAVALPRALTKITLNNSDETLKLMHPNGQVMDVISYGTAAKGATYTRSGDAWSWSNPTPNEISAVVSANATSEKKASAALLVPNITVSSSSNVPATSPNTTASETPAVIILETTEETENVSASDASDTSGSSIAGTASTGFQSMTIAQARAAALGTAVRVEGTVTALPGVFATQFFYLEDGAGIQVYLYSADFSALDLGDRVRVSGIMSQNRGEARVKLSLPEAIEILGHGSSIAHDIRMDAIGEAAEAQLVSVEAVVESARSDEMTLTEGEATLRVSARERTGISFAAIASGSRVRVTGIVSESNGVYALLPRFQSDIFIVEMANGGSSTAAGIVKPSGPPSGLYGGILLLGMLAALGFRFFRSRREEDLTLTNA